MPKKNQITVPEIADAFPALTESQFRLLGFCAYNGVYPPNPWTLNCYESHFEIPAYRTPKDRDVLTENGLLTDGHVAPSEYFRITIPLIRHFPEWASAFEELGKYRSDRLVYLWKVAKSLAANDLRAARNLRYPKKEEYL